MIPLDPPDEAGFTRCLFCRKMIDTRKVWQQVVSFTQVHLRSKESRRYVDTKPTGRFACWNCIDLLSTGNHPLQSSIIR